MLYIRLNAACVGHCRERGSNRQLSYGFFLNVPVGPSKSNRLCSSVSGSRCVLAKRCTAKLTQMADFVFPKSPCWIGPESPRLYHQLIQLMMEKLGWYDFYN